VGALWGLVVGVVLAVGIILIWPIRFMLRKRRAQASAARADNDAESSGAADNNEPESSAPT
jgi:hypothetical protein